MADSTTNLDTVLSTDSDKPTKVNATFDAMSPASVFGRRAASSAGLNFGLYGTSRWYINAAPVVKSNSTLSLTASGNRWINVNRALTISQASGSVFDPDKLGLYVAIVGTSSVSSYEEHRDPHHTVRFLFGDTTKAMSDTNQPLTYVEAMCDSLRLSGALTAQRDVIVPAVPRNYFIHANTTGGFGVRVKTASGAAATLADGALAVIVCDGTDCRAYGGTSGGTTGKHAIPIMAAAMRPTTTAGCAPLAQVEIAANQPEIVGLDFDPTTQEYAYWSLAMPKSWNAGTITFKAIWRHPATVTNFGVAWSLQAVATSNDDAMGVAYGTAVVVTDTGGTTNDQYDTAESSAITIAGTPAKQDVVHFRVSRETGNGSDNMAVDATLLGVVVYITTDAETDA